MAGAVTIAVTAPAYAAVVETTTYYYTPAPVTTYYYTPPPATTYYYTPPATTYYYQPTVIEVRTEPAITVEAPLLTEDQAITADVVDRIAGDPWISGRIGVETRNNDVTLSGTVTTPGQVRRAINDTRTVPGVRTVNNELRSRVGGSSY